VNPVHPGKVKLGVFLEHAKPGFAPPTSQVDAQPAVSGKGVANSVGAEPVLDHHDDPAAVVEVADRNAMAPSGATPHRFDDQCILPRSRVMRSTDSSASSGRGSTGATDSSPRRRSDGGLHEREELGFRP
jgi:hypothetical protein